MSERPKNIPEEKWLTLMEKILGNRIIEGDLSSEEYCPADLKSRCLERRPREVIACTWDLFKNQDMARWGELLEVAIKCPACLDLFEQAYVNTCQEAEESGILPPPRYILS